MHKSEDVSAALLDADGSPPMRKCPHKPQHEETEISNRERWKNGFHKSQTHYLLFCYQCFLLFRQQAPSIQ